MAMRWLGVRPRRPSAAAGHLLASLVLCFTIIACSAQSGSLPCGVYNGNGVPTVKGGLPVALVDLSGCVEGYASGAPPGAPLSAACNVSAQTWTDPCRPIVCHNQLYARRGSANISIADYTNNTRYNSTVTISCGRGFAAPGGGIPTIRCGRNGSWTPFEAVCADVDECRTNAHTCAVKCVNTDGSYVCRAADTCSYDSHNCSAGAFCEHTPGQGFACACLAGFKEVGSGCQDPDECADVSRCSPYATCQNLPGSYKCTCRNGFSGDGFSCVDVYECHNGTHDCSGEAVCHNEIGSYQCLCLGGFEVVDGVCRDVDECSRADLHPKCTSRATCRNLRGHYECVCPALVANDARLCTDDFACQVLPMCERAKLISIINRLKLARNGTSAEGLQTANATVFYATSISLALGVVVAALAIHFCRKKRPGDGLDKSAGSLRNAASSSSSRYSVANMTSRGGTGTVTASGMRSLRMTYSLNQVASSGDNECDDVFDCANAPDATHGFAEAKRSVPAKLPIADQQYHSSYLAATPPGAATTMDDFDKSSMTANELYEVSGDGGGGFDRASMTVNGIYDSSLEIGVTSPQATHHTMMPAADWPITARGGSARNTSHRPLAMRSSLGNRNRTGSGGGGGGGGGGGNRGANRTLPHFLCTDLEGDGGGRSLLSSSQYGSYDSLAGSLDNISTHSSFSMLSSSASHRDLTKVNSALATGDGRGGSSGRELTRTQSASYNISQHASPLASGLSAAGGRSAISSTSSGDLCTSQASPNNLHSGSRDRCLSSVSMRSNVSSVSSFTADMASLYNDLEHAMPSGATSGASSPLRAPDAYQDFRCGDRGTRTRTASSVSSLSASQRHHGGRSGPAANPPPPMAIEPPEQYSELRGGCQSPGRVADVQYGTLGSRIPTSAENRDGDDGCESQSEYSELRGGCQSPARVVDVQYGTLGSRIPTSAENRDGDDGCESQSEYSMLGVQGLGGRAADQCSTPRTTSSRRGSASADGRGQDATSPLPPPCTTAYEPVDNYAVLGSAPGDVPAGPYEEAYEFPSLQPVPGPRRKGTSGQTDFI